MAERRMFAKSIVLSDAFLDMPMTARCLYFTLGMLADDDGFVGSPKSIMRQCGATNDDLKILLAKRYVLGFESGVIVIKHWKLNNYLQKDRHHSTTYLEELNTLTLDDKGSYTEKNPVMYTNCIQDVSKMYTEDRLGKDSIGNNIVLSYTNVPDNTHSTSSEAEPPKQPRTQVDYKEIVDLYNQICVSFPHVDNISEDRKKAIKARLTSKYKVEDFKRLFLKAEASDFLKGANDRNWKATFDWLTTDRNMAKVLDGNYDNNTKKYSKGTGKAFKPRDVNGQYDNEQLEELSEL